jgi:hypothetical protein
MSEPVGENEKARQVARAFSVVASARQWLKATQGGDYHAQCDALRHLGATVHRYELLEATP